MTNTTESIASIISASIIDYDTHRDDISRDYADDASIHAFHRFAFTFTRAASADLTESLTFSTPRISPYSNELFSDKFYFSDSTYDEINNPLSICNDAQTLINILYEISPTELNDLNEFATLIADDIESMLDYEIDEIDDFDSLDSIIAELERRYDFKPTDAA